jgi:RNA polymerase sigma factor (sigma-70 family)
VPLPVSHQDHLVVENLGLLKVATQRLGISSTDARRDDLLSAGQEALIFAARRFDVEKASFRTYASCRVFGSMLNVLAVDSDRASVLATLAESDADVGLIQNDNGLDVERMMLASQVLAAIEKLPAFSRDLIKAHYFEERPLAAVGARRGLSKTRASVHLSRALGQLRQALDDEYSTWPSQTKATKRRFNDRDKAKVLRHARRPGTSLSELARQFDMPRTTIITWLRPPTRRCAAA